MKAIKTWFPECEIIHGLKTEYTQDRTFSIYDIINLLCKTKICISGRYHSYILSSVYNIPQHINYNYDNYKLQADQLSNLDKRKAINPLKIIYNNILNDNIFFSKNWDKNDRNDAIVRLHEKSGIAINLLQNYTNIKIESCLMNKINFLI